MNPRKLRPLVVPLLALGALGSLAATRAQVGPFPFVPPAQGAPARPGRGVEVPAGLEAVYNKARPAAVRVETGNGLGSGFIISSDGLIVTAAHVALGAESLRVVTSDGARLPATVVGYDELRDLALLRARSSRALPALKLAGGAPKAGDAVVAIGNSRGAFNAARPGRVTALDRSLSASFPSGLIASTMPLAPGDSGGPVLNAAGEVVGVAVAVGRDWGGYSSYAAPLTASSPVLRDLRAGVKRAVPVVGVSVLPLTPETVGELGYGSPGGLLVTSVAPGSGAARAGLRDPQTRAQGNRMRQEILSADAITAVDGRRVRSRDDLVGYLRTKKVGDSVELTVRRDGRDLRLRVTLGARSQA
jgi:S1-C subfamily serine protease